VRFLALSLRAFYIGLVFAWAILRYLGARLAFRGRTPEARDRLRGETLARALETLGATFVKFGQILGTRPDIFPEGVTTALARLQDGVPAARFADVRDVLEGDLSAEARAELVEIEELPVAAASVAQVHRGKLRDGAVVAIKVQRKEARRQIERDLALMRLFARLVDRLPRMKYVSLPGAVERFGDALHAQLDFRLEAENNRKLAHNFRDDPRIRVPRLYPALCGPRVLTMEFVDGVKAETLAGEGPGLAQAGFRCIAQMVFLDGFVHADMHPGNILYAKSGEIFLIDLGLVAEIPVPMRKPWTETFVAVATGDGPRAAELFYGYAPVVHGTDFVAFQRDITAHLDRLKGRPLHELEVTEAVGGAMAILRRHRVQVDPVFTVVQLAMLVAEGVGKQLDPHFDVYGCAMPFLMQAMVLWADGAQPHRPTPVS
jgi:ubiquinone biosynthesis protein